MLVDTGLKKELMASFGDELFQFREKL